MLPDELALLTRRRPSAAAVVIPIRLRMQNGDERALLLELVVVAPDAPDADADAAHSLEVVGRDDAVVGGGRRHHAQVHRPLQGGDEATQQRPDLLLELGKSGKKGSQAVRLYFAVQFNLVLN